jgi:Multiubiquitin
MEDKKRDEHEKKSISIIINGSEFSVPKEELSFTELVALAFENPPTGPKVIFTITYRRGHGDKPEGTLRPGETVKVKEGMIFNVTPTDQS